MPEHGADPGRAQNRAAGTDEAGDITEWVSELRRLYVEPKDPGEVTRSRGSRSRGSSRARAEGSSEVPATPKKSAAPEGLAALLGDAPRPPAAATPVAQDVAPTRAGRRRGSARPERSAPVPADAAAVGGHEPTGRRSGRHRSATRGAAETDPAPERTARDTDVATEVAAGGRAASRRAARAAAAAERGRRRRLVVMVSAVLVVLALATGLWMVQSKSRASASEDGSVGTVAPQVAGGTSAGSG